VAGFPRNDNEGDNEVKNCVKQKLDTEWIDLIKEAKEIGLTLEEIRLILMKLKRS